jgi:hypothetical protein
MMDGAAYSGGRRPKPFTKGDMRSAAKSGVFDLLVGINNRLERSIATATRVFLRDLTSECTRSPRTLSCVVPFSRKRRRGCFAQLL